MRISQSRLMGQRVKKLRKERKLTQIELAVIVNISPVYMGYIENGRRRPSLKTLERIARALKVKAKDLL